MIERAPPAQRMRPPDAPLCPTYFKEHGKSVTAVCRIRHSCVEPNRYADSSYVSVAIVALAPTSDTESTFGLCSNTTAPCKSGLCDMLAPVLIH
ncbi:hypothetical protein Mycch_6056 (plasmid) [Mycolicibacterium chubuense NBB4]|uniref:Uncharacterized protein n=1 Tax=Mycolicibacterium chubuense (strain NBB4) TaxID=710421 RepID=I4BTP9_MYCCN|nr:hypothetical protein Mycch_6056 [Mycolicibacterium chubuense NBB4]